MAEIESRLPAGFHDAELISLSIDYEKSQATIQFNLWMPSDKEFEGYAKAELRLDGLQYLIIEPPAMNIYIHRAEHDASPVDGYVTASRSLERMVLPPACEGNFAHSLFVFNWEASIHIAAKSAKLEPEALLQKSESANAL